MQSMITHLLSFIKMFNRSLVETIDSKVTVYSSQSHSEREEADAESSNTDQIEFLDISDLRISPQDHRLNERLTSKIKCKLTMPFKKSKVNFSSVSIKRLNDSHPEPVSLYVPKPSCRKMLTKTPEPSTHVGFRGELAPNKKNSIPDRFEKKGPALDLVMDEPDSLHRTQYLMVKVNYCDLKPKNPSAVCRSYFFQKATSVVSLGKNVENMAVPALDTPNCFFTVVNENEHRQNGISQCDLMYLSIDYLSTTSMDRDHKVETPETLLYSKASLKKVSLDFHGDFKKVSEKEVKKTPYFLSNNHSQASTYNSYAAKNHVDWQEDTFQERGKIIDVRDGNEYAHPQSKSSKHDSHSYTAQNLICGSALLGNESAPIGSQKSIFNPISKLIPPIEYATFAPLNDANFESLDSSNYDSNYCGDNIKSLNFFLDNQTLQESRSQLNKRATTLNCKSRLLTNEWNKQNFAKDKGCEKNHPVDSELKSEIDEFKYYDLIERVNQSQISLHSHDQIPLSNFSSNKMNSVEMSDITKSEMEISLKMKNVSSPLNTILKAEKSFDNLNDVSLPRKPSLTLPSFIDEVQVHSFEDDSERYLQSRGLELSSFYANGLRHENRKNTPIQALAKDAIDDQVDSKIFVLQRGHSESIISLSRPATQGSRNFSFRNTSDNL